MNDDEPTVSDATAQTVPGAPSGALPASGARYGRFVVVRALGAGGMGVVLLATDPELGRSVALKLLRPDLADEKGHARLVREAQAMAKLAHPNVVTVFEVGRSGDQVFVAMELVEGETLRAWSRASKRSWREIVAMYVGAGRGLVAAHEAGLVHRDFKPENVLVGRDNRPRVTDFGLVADGVAPEATAIADDAILTGLTVRGSALGTPGYMSSEQWAGEVVDARSDQFSFCVALWEALYGARPFDGVNATEISANVREGQIVSPQPGHGVPDWIEPLLRRGLAKDPTTRWPSLAVLLDRLVPRIASGARWIAAGVGAVAVAGAVVATIALATDHDPEPCPAPDQRIASVWNPNRRAELETKLAGIDPALGKVRFATVKGIVDRGVADWRANHVSACKATADGRQSEALLDQRMDCLDRWLDNTTRLLDDLDKARTREAIDSGVSTLTKLTQPGACADVTAFAEPLDANGKKEAREILAELERLDEERRAGKLEDAVKRTQALVERARKLEHTPSLAAALYGAVQFLSRANASDEKLLEELTRVAAIAGHDRISAYAWVELVRERGGAKDRPEQAEALYATADAALLRANDPPDLRFALNLARLNVLRDTGRGEEALVLLDRADAAIHAADPDRLPSPLLDFESRISFARGSLLDALGKRTEAIEQFRKSIAQRTELLGIDHPDHARALLNIGEAYRQSNKIDEAAKAYEEAARISESRVGENPLLAGALNRIAYTYTVRGRPDDALALYRRATAMGDRLLPPGHPRRIALHSDLGTALTAVGRYEEALAEQTQATDANAAAKRESNNVAIAISERAKTLVALGRFEPAIADYRRAIAMLDKLKTGEIYRVPMTAELAHALIEAGRPAEALALLERISPTDETEPATAIQYRYDLGRAKYATKRDVRGGIADARAARSGAEAAKVPAADIARMDAWLARHAR